MAGEQSRINGMNGGRPKGSVSEKTRVQNLMQARLTEIASERAEELFSTLFNLATGIKFQKDNETIYKQKPDRTALTWLLEQMVGKPTANVKVEQTCDQINGFTYVWASDDSKPFETKYE